jgi:monoamine oxidase
VGSAPAWMTRRALVQASAVAVGALAAPSTVLAAERSSVVVIGAGLAGLHAAMLLSDSGADVVVLEGGRRVGGRVFTDDASPLRPEYGASQIGASYARVAAVCHRLKVPLRIDTNTEPLPMSSRIGGTWVRSDRWASSPANRMVGAERAVQPGFAGSRFMAKYNRLKGLDDWLHPAFADLDVSLYDLMVRDGASPEAIRLADLSGFGNDIQSSSMLSLMQEATRTGFDRTFAAAHPEIPPLRKVVGGTSRLTEAMAASLGDRVRLGKIVSTLDMTGPKAEITCLDGARFRCDFVVSAIPFSLLRRITITPEAPDLQAEVVRLLPSGYTSRGFGVVSGEYWAADGLEPSFFSDETVKMLWVYRPNAGEDFHRCTVVMTGAAAMKIDLLPEDQARALVEAEMIRMRPSMAGKVKLHAWYGWGRDPLAQGCRHIFAPGQVTRFGQAMIQPHLRLHLAGEHTRRTDFGMEAAMESGERAATEIIEKL